MFEVGDAVEQRISRHTKNISNYFVRRDALANKSLFEVAQNVGPTLAEYSSIWSQANSRFGILLEQRQNDITRKIGNHILIGVASLMLGLGLAIAMFRSTLRRLDGVELAHREAVNARSEAEELASSISTINEDVVRMNHELTDNMKKLKSAQDELVKKGRMEQMGQLTATIAHELRNPLGAVRTSAFLIERKIKDKGMGVEPQLLRINNGITRCDNIITQLLDFSRTKQLTLQSDDLDQWLAKTIEEEAKALPAVVEIQCNLGLGGLLVPFDPARMQRAIINLVSNASEAMVGNGEDATRFAVSNPIITISSYALNGFAHISIADNGPGISPENLTRIREPLFTTKSFGTGLGIPAVEQIATQHGGTLELTSELGKGAAFIIKIPLVQIEEAAA
jgi:signal transduction histidine kinase